MSKRKEYKVIYPFRDLKDKGKKHPDGKVYAVGDIYYNKNATKERIKELSTNKNKIGKQLIESIIELDDLTVKELKEVAKEKEIQSYSTMKKEDLIESIEGD